MAHLNVAFKEAEEWVKNQSYNSLVLRSKFAPLANSETEFLPSKPSFAIYTHPKYIKHQIYNVIPQKNKSGWYIPHFSPIKRGCSNKFCACSIFQFQQHCISDWDCFICKLSNLWKILLWNIWEKIMLHIVHKTTVTKAVASAMRMDENIKLKISFITYSHKDATAGLKILRWDSRPLK